MNFFKAVLLFLFSVQAVFGQKQGVHVRETFIDTIQPLILRGSYPIANPDKLEGVRSFILGHFKSQLSGHSGILLSGVKHSPLATHYTFRQTYRGFPVYRSEVRVHLDAKNNIILLSALLFDCSNADLGKKDFDRISPEPDAGLIKSREPVVFFGGERPVAAIRYVLRDPEDRSSPELILGENAVILYQRDLRLYKNEGKDSTVSGYIFNPDPLTSAKQYYAAPYLDSNDGAVISIDFERKLGYTKAWFENDTFWLLNRYMRFVDFSGPYQGKMFSLQPEYYYSRSDKMFEAYNAFYHISKMQDYVSALGFQDLLDTVHVDPHALNNDDNSFFDFNDSVPTLAFGDGGVDDAEDADVVVHEFGHCMSYYAAPNTTNGSQRLAMEEGTADYLAASNSKNIDTFRFAQVYTWDGHNQFWPGRECITPVVYPNFQNNKHIDGQIWANALLLIQQSLGRGYTDTLVLNSLFFQSSNLSMPAMAQTFILIDSLISGGVHYKEIYQSFVDKKILAWHVSIKEPEDTYSIRLLSSAAFATGQEDAEIRFDEPFSGELFIYDLQGRSILELDLSLESSIKINPGTFAPGLYFVCIRNSSFQRTFKLLRY